MLGSRCSTAKSAMRWRLWRKVRKDEKTVRPVLAQSSENPVKIFGFMNVQLLREVAPALSHVVMLINSLNPFHIASVRQALAAAQTIGIRLQQLDVHKSEDLDGVFAALRKDRPDGLFILADRIFLHNRQRIADFAVEQRLPSINAYEELVEAGGLMSYGPSYEDMHRRAAAYVDKILKGAKPGNLPIEQPTKFTFIINLGTAKTLGVTVPSQLLGLADRLIE